MAKARERLYYIQDARTFCGNSVFWWRVDGCGYTCNLDEAWKLKKSDAEKICRDRSTDKMWPCEEIDARSARHFDMQKFREVAEVKRVKS